jgi:hypothetical protein
MAAATLAVSNDSKASNASGPSVVVEVVEVVEVGEPVPEPAALVVWSKADQWPGVVVPAGVIATSSRSGAGIVELIGAVIAQLIPEAGEPGLLDGAVPFLPRHLELLDRLLGADPAGQSPAIQ